MVGAGLAEDLGTLRRRPPGTTTPGVRLPRVPTSVARLETHPGTYRSGLLSFSEWQSET